MAEVEMNFDPSLKGAHFEDLETKKVFKATGKYKQASGLRAVELVSGYTPECKYVLETALQLTKKKLSVVK